MIVQHGKDAIPDSVPRLTETDIDAEKSVYQGEDEEVQLVFEECADADDLATGLL
jgi:hypothetical protein